MDYASITGGVAVEGFFWMWFESGCNWTFSDCGHSFFCLASQGGWKGAALGTANLMVFKMLPSVLGQCPGEVVVITLTPSVLWQGFGTSVGMVQLTPLVSWLVCVFV